MTTVEAIDRLIEAVEAGGQLSGNDDFWAAFHAAFPRQQARISEAVKAYHSSLDAALALHKAMLPGWIWEKRGGELVVQHWAVEYSHADHDNPARARLLAILRAHRHQIATTQHQEQNQ